MSQKIRTYRISLISDIGRYTYVSENCHILYEYSLPTSFLNLFSECNLWCPKFVDPVCTSIVQNYVNECAFEKQNCLVGGVARKTYNGFCAGRPYSDTKFECYS